MHGSFNTFTLTQIHIQHIHKFTTPISSPQITYNSTNLSSNITYNMSKCPRQVQDTKFNKQERIGVLTDARMVGAVALASLWRWVREERVHKGMARPTSSLVIVLPSKNMYYHKLYPEIITTVINS